ncbi:ATP-binding cassette domain-containing protein [Microbacterium sp. MEC084]|uniref:ATP-binding cassette domain-containing protein n=1 Tax=unclassified Microbacterium TaxID=2609290 RepID=UPI0006F3BF0A|nr:MULTISPECIES: ATP-binding cassette domain-containing protein [unclassified Microbacterium]KQZ05064.1 ABC transporter ATP-binding protein [Microbacterium sp. Root53]MCD1267712.1 ATP-binding cassette domain-containing protein [Microbacterium sp. MEC084]
MIEFRSVRKTYPDGAGESVAVDDVSLIVPSHRTVVLVGSSGSGKTTLLRMVNRMVEPTSGAVLIDDEDVRHRDPVALRRGIGYVMQQAGLLPHVRVIDNIATVPVLNGVPRREARERARALMDTVGLDGRLADRYPGRLSGGQQQRVGVARALAGDPNILLMDEPFGAVDPIVRRELQQELLRLQQTLGKTILFVTHDVDEAFLLGDEVVILAAGGRIAQKGTPEEILAAPADDFVAEFVGIAGGDRELTLRRSDGATVIVDAAGRVHGVLREEGAPRG